MESPDEILGIKPRPPLRRTRAVDGRPRDLAFGLGLLLLNTLVGLGYSAFAIGHISATTTTGLSPGVTKAIYVFAYLAGAIISIVLYILIWRRKNWARIVVLVLAIIGLIPFVNELVLGQASIINLLTGAATIVGVVLIFRPAANAWLKGREAEVEIARL